MLHAMQYAPIKLIGLTVIDQTKVTILAVDDGFSCGLVLVDRFHSLSHMLTLGVII